jgi:hypothetical protein
MSLADLSDLLTMLPGPGGKPARMLQQDDIVNAPAFSALLRGYHQQ